MNILNFLLFVLKMPVLIHSVFNFNNLKNILKDEEIIPLCSNEKGIGNYLEKEETCGDYNIEDILEERKNLPDVKYDSYKAEYFSYVNCIFNPQRIDTSWNYEKFNIIIDPEMLEKNKNKHIHMSLHWSYGLISNNTILYNKYISPLENLDILYDFYKFNTKNYKKQSRIDIEIVSKSFDLKDCIIGVIYNQNAYEEINKNMFSEDELIEIKKLKKEYPDKLWFSSMKEFKNFFKN